MPDNYYETKKRWNAANYKQLNINVSPELYKTFQMACEQNRSSMRKTITDFMTKYAVAPVAVKKPTKEHNSRSHRRKAVKIIADQLTKILEDEESYKSNIPDNLRNSSRYTAAEQAAEAMEAAIGLLNEAFM